MPKEIKAYRCVHHGCKKPPTITRKPIENHEKTCFYNPERRSCKICGFYKVGGEGNECTRGYHYSDNMEYPEMYERLGICFDCNGFEQYPDWDNL